MKLLVVDDDRTVLHLIDRWFSADDTEVVVASSADEALDKVRQEKPDVLLLDIMLPRLSGFDACKAVGEIDPRLPVIFITGHGSSEMAIEAMKLGAFDYLLKPLEKDRVLDLVARAAEIRRLTSIPVAVSPTTSDGDDARDIMLGDSDAMQRVFKAIGRVAAQDVTVLIQGESGTGKELVARAIYQHSHRASGPFLAINCAAIPEMLLESEFFGHEKGSFTGAASRRIGKFEQCSGGTIFLDEIGDMPHALQSKILRLLQEQKFERVGGNETISTDVRIIAATNRNLDELVHEQRFREDLLYRLKGFLITLPPLRDRAGDVSLLVDHFLNRYNRKLGNKALRIEPEVFGALQSYDWPGNVRELESVIKQALINVSGSVVTLACLPALAAFRPGAHSTPMSNGEAAPLEPPALDQLPRSDLAAFVEHRLTSDTKNLHAEAVELMERYLIARVLRETNGNQSLAARMLGITRGSLRNKIRLLQLSIGHIVTVHEPPSEEPPPSDEQRKTG
jgi:two-component system nitrogen regulation response regulator GlnG